MTKLGYRFNQSKLSDESKDVSFFFNVSKESTNGDLSPATATDDWLKETKKINNAILLYEKINDTAYFNQSTLSDESKDERDALLSDSKDESKDAVFNEIFGFSGDNSLLWKILPHRMGLIAIGAN